MKKKGFTLVELLGVVVVLGIILITAVPSIIETFKNSSNRENTVYLERLYASAETYLELNREAYDQLNTVGGHVDIPIKTLILEGLVKTLGKDPETGTTILETHTIVATKEADLTVSYALYFSDTNIDSYEKDGLILHLDAINNVGFGHNNESTVWNDLSTSNNDVLNVKAGKWTNNSLLFQDATDILKTKNLIPSSLLGKNYTLEIYLNSNTYRYTQIGLNGSATLKLRIVGDNPYWNAMPIIGQQYTSQYTLNVKNSFVYRNNFTGSSANKWINGVMTSATVSNLTATNDYFDLGHSEYFLGEIYAIRLYNRALTNEEIANNYALDQNRYR